MKAVVYTETESCKRPHWARALSSFFRTSVESKQGDILGGILVPVKSSQAAAIVLYGTVN